MITSSPSDSWALAKAISSGIAARHGEQSVRKKSSSTGRVFA